MDGAKLDPRSGFRETEDRMAEARSIWAGRFIFAALLQGLVLFAITAVLLYVDAASFLGLPGGDLVTPAAVVAEGSAGTWFTVGYFGYLIVPILGSGVSALFYREIEVSMQRPYAGWHRWLAWGHLLLGNAALGAGLGLMMYGGYFGGALMVPATLGGQGQTAYYVHTHVLGALAEPISILLILGMLGPLLGGIGYALKFRETV